MSENKINLQKELITMQYDLYLRQRIDCSKEDNKKYKELTKQGKPLPDGVYPYKTDNGEDMYRYYTIYTPNDLTKEERYEYILLKQYKLIKTIKNCVLFFTVLAIVSLITSFLTFA